MMDEDLSDGLAPEPPEDMSSDDEDEADETEIQDLLVLEKFSATLLRAQQIAVAKEQELEKSRSPRTYTKNSKRTNERNQKHFRDLQAKGFASVANFFSHSECARKAKEMRFTSSSSIESHAERSLWTSIFQRVATECYVVPVPAGYVLWSTAKPQPTATECYRAPAILGRDARGFVTGAAIDPGARVADDGAALEEPVVARDARGFVTDTPMGFEEPVLARDARGFVTSTPDDVGARAVEDNAGFEEPLLARDTRGFMAGAAIDPGARVADDNAGVEEPVVARDARGFVRNDDKGFEEPVLARDTRGFVAGAPIDAGTRVVCLAVDGLLEGETPLALSGSAPASERWS
ncbi:hypothetical protein B0H14DRAFT_3673806 [Mycena olivaceomarginata]|nr:hypothetical protein B0H14DRAFT_3673806 [Mycena olivaceomarginata]